MSASAPNRRRRRRRRLRGDRAQPGHAGQPGVGPAPGIELPDAGVRLAPARRDGGDRGGHRPEAWLSRWSWRAAAANSSSASPNASSWNWSFAWLPRMSCRRGSRAAAVSFVGHGAAVDRVGGLAGRARRPAAAPRRSDRVVEQWVRRRRRPRPARRSTGRGSRRSGSRSCGPLGAFGQAHGRRGDHAAAGAGQPAQHGVGVPGIAHARCWR